MTLHAQEYPRAGDTLYSGRLDNGLAVYVVPRPGFRKKQAMLSVNYGGATRSFSLSGGRGAFPRAQDVRPAGRQRAEHPDRPRR